MTKVNEAPKPTPKPVAKTETTKPKTVKPVPTSGGSYTVKDGKLIKH